MVKNYLKILIRNITRQRFYAFINIFGLTVGLVTSLLIVIYILDEFSYDTFHRDFRHIFRVDLNGRLGDQEFNSCYTSAPVANRIKLDIPEVDNACRIAFWDDINIQKGNISFIEKKLMLADSNFFDFFSFKLLSGNYKDVLSGPNKIVLTESEAGKLFTGENINYNSMIGSMLLIGKDEINCMITGITEDPPENSHFHYTMILSMDTYPESKNTAWINNILISYIKKNTQATKDQIETKFPGLINKFVGPQVQQALGISLAEFYKQGGKYGFYLEPITSIHLNSMVDHDLEAGGSMNNVYILTAIAIFIIIIACINFMNLSTARFSTRAKEVGIRKFLGSSRRKLIFQFLGESTLYSFAAIIFAIIIIALAVPAFNSLSGKTLNLNDIINFKFLISLLVLILFVSICAGIYPALYLTTFKPSEVLRGKIKAGIKSSGIRRTLVIFQFSISTGLIILTFLIFKQLNHLQTLNLGFNQENLLVIRNINSLGQDRFAFKEELRKSNDVINVTISNLSPPEVNYSAVFRPINGGDKDYGFNYYFVDYDYLKTLEIPLVQGRFFSEKFPSDSNAVLINESAAEMIGFSNPVGERIQTHWSDGDSREIIGVIKNFNFISLKDKISPLVIFPGNHGDLMTVRLSRGNINLKINNIKSKWQNYTTSSPFDFTFVDADFDAKFKKEKQLGNIFMVFTLFSIFVAALGLIGLATFTTRQRAKEIGIRKVLGSSSISIIGLLLKEYLKLIGISFVIAIPLCIFFMNWWLQNFAYKIELGYPGFILGGILTTLIALFAVGLQSMKAALMNPAASIQYE